MNSQVAPDVAPTKRTKINQLHTLRPWNWKAERYGSEAKLAA
jgi:hypothetical protein